MSLSNLNSSPSGTTVRLLVLMTLLICLAAYVLGETPGISSDSGQLSEFQMRKVLADTCDQVNAYYEDEHFPIPAPSPALCDFALRSNPHYDQMVGFFSQNEKTSLEGAVLAKSGRVISFYNWAAFNAGYGLKAPFYSKRPPPQLTTDKAVKMGAKFAAIFIKPWAARLGQPNALFTWPFTGFDSATRGAKPKQGEWSIKWRRVTASGIPFLTDGVELSFSEEYGPFGIAVYMRATYDDQPVTPIAREKALIEARKGLEKLLASPSAKNWLPGGQPQGDPDMALYIVCPNDLQVNKSMLAMAYGEQGKGRLAWVATYAVSNPSAPAVNDHVSVYIDAKDGSFLGGML